LGISPPSSGSLGLAPTMFLVLLSRWKNPRYLPYLVLTNGTQVEQFNPNRIANEVLDWMMRCVLPEIGCEIIGRNTTLHF